MELHQLRYLVAVYENACNVSIAARQLGLSQPGITRQLRLLEVEVGYPIFDRSEPRRPRPTPAGAELIASASSVLREAWLLAEECKDQHYPGVGRLGIVIADPEVRHVLPDAIVALRTAFPAVAVHLHDASLDEVAPLIRQHQLNMFLAADPPSADPALTWLPCYRWQHRLLQRPDDARPVRGRLTLEQLADLPLVTTNHGAAGRAALDALFEVSRLRARIVMTADSGVTIAAYVRAGIGAGLVGPSARAATCGLLSHDTGGVLPTQTTWVGVPRGAALPAYAYAFLETLAPHLSRSLVDECRTMTDQAELNRVLDDVYIRLVE